MEENEYTGVGVAREELEQIQSYKEIFLETHPYPEEPEYEIFDKAEYKFSEVVGVTAAGFAVSAIGGIIFAAIRTMMVFVETEVSQLEGYGWSAGITLVVGIVAAVSIMSVIELFLAAWGYEKGKDSGELDLNYIGPGIAAAISALAGFIPSLSLLPDGPARGVVEGLLGWLLFGLSGLGITALVYFGAHNLGVIHTKWLLFLDEKENELDNRNADKRRDYDNKVTAWNNALENDYRRKGRELLFGKGTYVVPRGGRSGAGHRNSQGKQVINANSNGATDAIRNLLKDKGILPSEVGGGDEHRMRPAEIADILEFDDRDRKQIHTYLGHLRKQEQAGNF